MALAQMLPEIALAALGAILILVESFSTKDVRRTMTLLTAVGAALAAGLAMGGGTSGGEFLNGFILRDGAAVYSRVLFCGVLALVALMLYDYSGVRRVKAGEMLAILSFATLGLMQMAGSGDLLGIYLGLELVSISSYLLAGMQKGSSKSAEAAIKYFLMGALASAVLLFGISLVYGVTGKTNLVGIAQAIAALGEESQYFPVVLVGSLMVIGGFLFKVSAAPFHMWAPDTYEGAPTPVTAFLSVGPKAAAFVALLRVTTVALPALRSEWMVLFGVISVITMFVGNLSALHQTDLKRLFAYSSIAQAGYILAAFLASTGDATKAILFYATAYALMNLGAFAVVMAVEMSKGTTSIDGLKGMWKTRPWLAAAMVAFLISLIGIPPTGGMFAKLLVIGGLVTAGRYWLAVAVVINTVISVPYYYGLIKAMYLNDADSTRVQPADVGTGARLPGVRVALGAVLAVSVAGVVVLGLFPEPIIEAVTKATIAALH